MQLALSTTIASPSIPVWDELSGNSRQGFTTKNQAWNPGPNVVNSTTQIGLRASLLLEGFGQSHSARYYNPLTGRFLSRDAYDPQLFDEHGNPTDPKVLHKYLYAQGDPVNLTDPTGASAIAQTAELDSIEVQTAVLAAVAVKIAVDCAYNYLATGTRAYVSLGLAQWNGTVERKSACSNEERDKCDKRRDDEEARCWAKYGFGGKYGDNPKRNACLQRVEWRWNACLRGLPDPGPPLAELKSIFPTDSDDTQLVCSNPIDSSSKTEISHGGF